MIHVLKGGVPSVAKIIQIPGSAPPDTTPPAQVAGLSVTAASSTHSICLGLQILNLTLITIMSTEVRRLDSL